MYKLLHLKMAQTITRSVLKMVIRSITNVEGE